MSSTKNPHLTDVDISTLETIYADGRAMGRLVQDFKNDLAAALLKIATLESELRTERFRLKQAIDLRDQALAGRQRLHPLRESGTKRDTAKVFAAKHR